MGDTEYLAAFQQIVMPVAYEVSVYISYVAYEAYVFLFYASNYAIFLP